MVIFNKKYAYAYFCMNRHTRTAEMPFFFVPTAPVLRDGRHYVDINKMVGVLSIKEPHAKGYNHSKNYNHHKDEDEDGSGHITRIVCLVVGVRL